MAIIKKEEVRPERPVIIVLYGVPGIGKTSVATTANNPLLIDTDRGADRACKVVDTIFAQRWSDINNEREAMKTYNTIIVDTARAMLDDYLSQHAIDSDARLARNTLKRYGKMGEDFKEFVNFLRSNGSDVIFVCHDKEQVEGDFVRHAPDCTGQSKDLLLRIADQVGYIYPENGQRLISFTPDDTHIGKDVAGLKKVAIPDSSTPEFDTFMQEVIANVKHSIQNRSEAQRQANAKLMHLRELLAKAKTKEEVDNLLSECATLPTILKKPFFEEMKSALVLKGFVFESKAKGFVLQEEEEAISDTNA